MCPAVCACHVWQTCGAPRARAEEMNTIGMARTKCLPSHNNLFIYGSTFSSVPRPLPPLHRRRRCRRSLFTCKFTPPNYPYFTHTHSQVSNKRTSLDVVSAPLMTTFGATRAPSRQTMQLVKTSCSSIFFPFVFHFQITHFTHSTCFAVSLSPAALPPSARPRID